MIPLHEITFEAMRASGPGGQSVNTTDSAVRGSWNISQYLLDSPEKLSEVIAYLDAHHHRYLKRNQLGQVFLVAKSQTEKSQLHNKHHVLNKLNNLLTEALAPRKQRTFAVPKPIKARINHQRLQNKTKKSQTKKLRLSPALHE